MAHYVKVTKEVAAKLVDISTRNKTADGNVLLWQADLNSVPGDTLTDRAASVGGVVLTPIEAKEETDGKRNTPLPGADVSGEETEETVKVEEVTDEQFE